MSILNPCFPLSLSIYKPNGTFILWEIKTINFIQIQVKILNEGAVNKIKCKIKIKSVSLHCKKYVCTDNDIVWEEIDGKN